MGTKDKFWFDGVDGQRWLAKLELRGAGDDWSEKLASEFAELLGLPHVPYELAHEIASNKPAVVCPILNAPGQTLVHGNELLFAVDPDYPRESPRYKCRHHTVEAIESVVDDLVPPPATQSPRGTIPGTNRVHRAADYFVGYLMLDVWISNQDRHHENWAAVDDGIHRWLAPTFDHASGLAHILRDDERRKRLQTRDAGYAVSGFVRKGRSAIYASPTDTKPMPLLDAFLRFADNHTAAKDQWLQRLSRIDAHEVAQLISRVPRNRLSPVSAEFTERLLTENRKRLLEAA